MGRRKGIRERFVSRLNSVSQGFCIILIFSNRTFECCCDDGKEGQSLQLIFHLFRFKRTRAPTPKSTLTENPYQNEVCLHNENHFQHCRCSLRDARIQDSGCSNCAVRFSRYFDSFGWRVDFANGRFRGLAMELSTGRAIYIGLLTFGSGRNKQIYFQETPLQNYANFQVKGPRNQTFTVIAKAEAPGTQYAGVSLEQNSAIGLNSTVTIRTSPSKLDWILPKSLKSQGLVVTQNAAESFFSQGTGTYTLNAKLTLQYNNAGLGIDDYVSSMRDYYTKKGVSEAVLPPAE